MTFRKYIVALILAVAASSCSDDATELSVMNNVDTSGIIINADITGIQYQSITLKFVNLSSNEVTEADYFGSFDLVGGIYDVEVTAVASINTLNYTFFGKTSSVVITNAKPQFAVSVYARNVSSPDFVIEEIFFTGTLYPTGSQYNGDNYIKIFNNTDHTLYADGLGIVESKFTSTQKYDYTPDIRQDTMAVQALYVIPGGGTDYPVEPGKSLIICDIGIDHKVTNANSFDLSMADFEWYDVSTVASVTDIDGEGVSNLDKWYCYTASIFSFHNRGFKSYAIVRIPSEVSKQQYLNDFYYSYTYGVVTDYGVLQHSNYAYKMPNAWIVDGVNCSVESNRTWDILPANIDAGWTHCGEVDGDKNRYFKSVRRKLLTTIDGRRVLQDTNNSSDDFNTECIPSLIEEQHSAINAQGDCAQTITIDGVTKVDD